MNFWDFVDRNAAGLIVWSIVMTVIASLFVLSVLSMPWQP